MSAQLQRQGLFAQAVGAADNLQRYALIAHDQTRSRQALGLGRVVGQRFYAQALRIHDFKQQLACIHHLTGDGVLLFPGEKSRNIPISDNTLRAALQTLGYGSDVQTVHGFRATARTLLDEVLEFDPLVIEAQLAHTVKDANGRAYNRTTYLKQRADMMQRWADYLDRLAAGAEVIEFKRA